MLAAVDGHSVACCWNDAWRHGLLGYMRSHLDGCVGRGPSGRVCVEWRDSPWLVSVFLAEMRCDGVRTLVTADDSVGAAVGVATVV